MDAEGYAGRGCGGGRHRRKGRSHRAGCGTLLRLVSRTAGASRTPLGANRRVTMSISGLRCSRWDGDFSALLWPIDVDRPAVIGAIGLSNCRLVGFTLQRVGLGVPSTQVDQVISGFNVR